MRRILLLAVLAVFLYSCNSEKEEIVVQPGVDLEMAQYRKSVLSVVNYKLEFRIPENFE